jgi:hypothetical protein
MMHSARMFGESCRVWLEVEVNKFTILWVEDVMKPKLHETEKESNWRIGDGLQR